MSFPGTPLSCQRGLQELPASVMPSLTCLTTLNLSGNCLTRLPDTLGQCTALRELTASVGLTRCGVCCGVEGVAVYLLGALCCIPCRACTV